MSYQPRRFATEDAAPVPEVASCAPRRASVTVADRVLSRGGALATGVTVVATTAAVVAGVATGGPAAAVAPSPAPSPSASAEPTPSGSPLIAVNLSVTKKLVASGTVKKAKAAAVGLAVSRQFTTSSLSLRSAADSDSELVARLATGAQVAATSKISGKYRQVVYDDELAWVLNDELSKVDPNEGIPEGTSMESCSRGSAVESKLRQATIFIYRSVCPLFPEVNSYGGWRAGGMQFHKNGRALDIMLTPGKESALGHRIANYLIAHAKLFQVDHIIFEQHIWTPGTPHWRKMGDRGSLNANHFNHVHVAVAAGAK